MLLLLILITYTKTVRIATCLSFAVVFAQTSVHVCLKDTVGFAFPASVLRRWQDRKRFRLSSFVVVQTHSPKTIQLQTKSTFRSRTHSEQTLRIEIVCQSQKRSRRSFCRFCCVRGLLTKWPTSRLPRSRAMIIITSIAVALVKCVFLVGFSLRLPKAVQNCPG